MDTQEPHANAPIEPESIEQAGLGATLVEHLIIKILYFRGELYGQDLCQAMALRFSVIQEILEALILQHQIQVKRSLGVGRISSLLSLTESGRSRAREYLEANQYAGPAPVPMEQYAEMVRVQRPRAGWLTKEALRESFSGMVITERLLSQVGPAVSAANSLLLYGKPGDGKTFLIEQLNNLEGSAVFLPYAIECQGNIIQVFDPIFHQRVDGDDQPSVLTVAVDRSHDRRWVKCKRPFIVSGGELSLDMLDLRHNRTSNIYEAPFQLKANNGIYLIDDFGRQHATPAEVLNRWIVPMERRVDYLSFLTGGKMTAPFETFLVFSTNLNPSNLGDEAFLRRIQYKLLLHSPSEAEFSQIFQRACVARKIPCSPGLLGHFLEKRFRRTGKALRRCQPRDLLFHALNLIHFEKLPHALTDEILDRAFESCFVEEQETAAPQPSAAPQTHAAPLPSAALQTSAAPQAPAAPLRSVALQPSAPLQTLAALQASAPPQPSAALQTSAALQPSSTLRTSAALQLQPSAPQLSSTLRTSAALQPSAALDLAAQSSRIPTVFGRLCFLAEHRDESGSGRDARTPASLHLQAFQDWLGLTLEQKSRDLKGYTSAVANCTKISDDRAGFIERLTPAGFLAADGELFAYGLNTLLDICTLNGVEGLAAA
jgi:DNA-binding MarR family transcriptional regulator